MQDEVRWQVGVLRSGEENVVWARPGAENVAWVTVGYAPDWTAARAATIAAMHSLVASEGRQEYRLQIDDAEGIVNPAQSPGGELVIGDLERLIPVDRDVG